MRIKSNKPKTTLAAIEHDNIETFNMKTYETISLDEMGDGFILAYSEVKNAPNNGNIDFKTQVKVMEEEIEELIEQLYRPDGIKGEALLKEICDVIVTLNITARLLDYDLDEAQKLVHESNMLKFQGAEFREDGKLLKGPNYVKPDLSGCI